MIAIRPNFPVDDITRAVDFYRRTLGFEVRQQAPEYGLAILGSRVVELALLAGTPAGPASAYLEVVDVDAAFQACEADGEVEITAPLTTEPWGLRDFGMRDPWGNSWAWASESGTERVVEPRGLDPRDDRDRRLRVERPTREQLPEVAEGDDPGDEDRGPDEAGDDE